MPWISQKRLDELEGAPTPTRSGNITKAEMAQREADIIAAFRTLWPKHAATLRALSKRRNVFADIMWPEYTTEWAGEDIKTLIDMAAAKRSDDRAEKTRSEIAALRAGAAL